MRPVYQAPGDKQCLRACVASIFEAPIERVPFFGGAFAHEPERTEYALLQERELRDWLRGLGLAHQCIVVNDEGNPRPVSPWGLCVANGPTERGTQHAVVWDVGGHWTDHGVPQWNPETRALEYGRMVHDPHPSGAGLLKVESWTCFVVRDPARVRRALLPALGHRESIPCTEDA